MQKNNLKRRYKMYKAKKNWVIVPIVFLGLAMGASIKTVNVLADENTSSDTVGQTLESQKNADSNSSTEQSIAEIEKKASSNDNDQESTTLDSSGDNEDGSATLEVSAGSQISTDSTTVKNETDEDQQAGGEVKEAIDENAKQAPVNTEENSSKQVPQTKSATDIFQTPTDYVEKNQDGHWYLYNSKTNTPYIGFQKLKDGRVVYYGTDGQMQYGWQWIENATRYFDTFDGKMAIGQQKINDHWYLFNDKGEMQRGFQYIPAQNKTVYYNKDGWMQYGWQWIENATRYFDTFDGKMAIGQQKINDHWYLFNDKGEMQRGFQYIPAQNKTVYYNKDGWMLYGQQNIDDHWYNFDNFDGAMKTGFINIPDQNKTVYYNSSGQMQYGWQWIENATRYFDTFDGKMAIGQQKINGHWYLFNDKGEMQRGFQHIPAQNKTVYYNKDGWMLYGVQQINQNKYYFDVITGAMKIDGVAYDRASGKLSYYDRDGKQISGHIVLDGRDYNFTDGTLMSEGQQLLTFKGQTYLLNNSLVVTGQQKLNGHWYYFDINTGVMARGFQYLSDQNKTVYYNDQGQMQYGQQKINDHWYLFDTFNGAMKIGFQYIADQNKTVYYSNNGQMVYGWQDISGHRYFFDRVTGAKASSEILWIDGNAYAFDDQGRVHNFAELSQLVNQLGSNIAVAIQSQKSGQVYSYSNSGNMRFKTASTVKVAVLAELLHNTGGNLTDYQRRLAENMIRNSDNASTTELITYHLHEAGNPVNRLYRDLGMNDTTPGTASWGSTLTTPADQLKLLYQIYMTNNSSYINQKSQNYLKELMHTINPSQRWGISAGSSDFYLKNGWVTYDVPWYVNSIGFIPNNGHGYTIAVYSYNNSLSTGINKVEQVARKVGQMLK